MIHIPGHGLPVLKPTIRYKLNLSYPFEGCRSGSKTRSTRILKALSVDWNPGRFGQDCCRDVRPTMLKMNWDPMG